MMRKRRLGVAATTIGIMLVMAAVGVRAFHSRSSGPRPQTTPTSHIAERDGPNLGRTCWLEIQVTSGGGALVDLPDYDFTYSIRDGCHVLNDSDEAVSVPFVVWLCIDGDDVAAIPNSGEGYRYFRCQMKEFKSIRATRLTRYDEIESDPALVARIQRALDLLDPAQPR